MKNLYIDFDVVILDTITCLYKDPSYIGKDRPYEEQNAYFSNYPWEKIIKDENILCDSINAIKEIIDSNKFNIAILTHVTSINEAVLKINYLRKYFDDITIIPCPKSISKTNMVHTKDSILVDDYSGNLREWESEGGIGIKFSQEEEKDCDFKVIKNLRELLKIF